MGLHIAALMAAVSLAQSAPPSMQLLLVGDSTMQAGSGYGVQLCSRFGPPAKCEPRGRGGTTTKTYRSIGSWDAALKLVTDGKARFAATYIFIQLGTNGTGEGPGEYKANLGVFVDEARAAGAIPVLITPVTTRTFRDGKLVNSLKARSDEVSALAAEKGVTLIELNRLSAAYVQSIGPSAADDLSWVAPPPEVIAASLSGTSYIRPRPAPPPSTQAAPPRPAQAPRTFDYTHMNARAGMIFSGMVADEIRLKLPALAPYLVEPPAQAQP